MTTSKTPKSRKRELDEILSRYADILNSDGDASAREQAYLKRYAADEDVLRLLHGARAVKTLFEAFGEFPDLGPKAGRRPVARNRGSSRIPTSGSEGGRLPTTNQKP